MLRAATVLAPVVLLIACTPAPSAPSRTLATVDCGEVVGMTPEEAGVYLAERGYSVSWRLERTTEAGPVAEVVSTAPEGVITDMLVEDGEAIVFVTPADDPLLAEIPVGQGCPGD